jgi:hypothetical protein|tara:strand:- start:134 stop:247 length:114 start_codon:yes stop_codon:yes gene_type:complete
MKKRFFNMFVSWLEPIPKINTNINKRNKIFWKSEKKI